MDATSAWRKRTKKKCVEYLGGKCQNCGYNECLAALDFHHRDPEAKEFSIAQYMCSWDKIKIELDKCDLLCSNCHRKKHNTFNGVDITANIRPRSKPIFVTCHHCKVVFQRAPNKIKGKKLLFCSVKCRHEYQKQIASVGVCRVCGSRLKKKGMINCSKQCALLNRYRISWPSDEELSKLVWQSTLTELSCKLGVSDKAIKKRCDKRGIGTPPQGWFLKTKD